MKKTRTPFKTPAPTISEAQLAMIRHTAKRYLIAGGSITIAADGAGDREEFIGNTRHALNPRDGRLETRSVLRIVRTRGAAVGIKLWTHGLRHSAITVAIEQGQKAGIGLDQIRHFSRHKQVATMMLYRDERDQAKTQEQLARIVAGSLCHVGAQGS